MNASAIVEIIATVQMYLDGLYEGDVNKLRQSFSPSCHLLSVSDGKLSVLPLDAWFKLVEGRPSPESQNFDRRAERILNLQQDTSSCASVTLNCAAPGRRFVDHLNLAKVENRWQIVNKLFHADVVA